MAILAGDALLTIAFETIANCKGFASDRLLDMRFRSSAERRELKAG